MKHKTKVLIFYVGVFVLFVICFALIPSTYRNVPTIATYIIMVMTIIAQFIGGHCDHNRGIIGRLDRVSNNVLKVSSVFLWPVLAFVSLNVVIHNNVTDILEVLLVLTFLISACFTFVNILSSFDAGGPVL